MYLINILWNILYIFRNICFLKWTCGKNDKLSAINSFVCINNKFIFFFFYFINLGRKLRNYIVMFCKRLKIVCYFFFFCMSHQVALKRKPFQMAVLGERV